MKRCRGLSFFLSIRNKYGFMFALLSMWMQYVFVMKIYFNYVFTFSLQKMLCNFIISYHIKGYLALCCIQSAMCYWVDVEHLLSIGTFRSSFSVHRIGLSVSTVANYENECKHMQCNTDTFASLSI